MKRNKDSLSHLKFLAVIDIIKKNSDSKHPITIKEIQNHIYNSKYDFSLDSRLVKKYVDYYNDFFDDDIIYCSKTGKCNFFYYMNSTLELMEAKAILDLVYSSDFFTLTTKKNYKKRIQNIFNTHYHPYFNKNLNLHIKKNENDKAFYNELEIITDAIYKHKKISFEYHKPSLETENLKKKVNVLAPIDTCFANNEYYLLCQGNKDANLCICYRLDYISNVTIIEDSHVVFTDYQIQLFTNTLNHMTYMYNEGNTEYIELEFDKSIYSNIIDKFGRSIHPKKINETTYCVQIKNTINSTFYSWIIGFGGKIQIVGNNKQINNFKNFLIDNFNLLKQK